MNTDKITVGWSRKTATHFENAVATNPRSAFVETILRPALVTETSYLPTGRGSDRKGKDAAYSIALHHSQDWQSAGHFANPLAYPKDDLRPLERVVFPEGGHIIFTLECDPASIDDPDIGLERQIEWMRTSKSKNGSAKRVPILDLFDALSAFPNFVGIVANWSGNKSVHIHVAMSTADPLGCDLVSRGGVREGLIAHWHKLNAIAHPIFFPGRPLDDPKFKFDHALRLPDQFRRVPGGTRWDRETKTKAVGPQPVLFERMRARAANGAQRSFWQAELFVAPAPVRKVVRSAKVKAISNSTTLTDPQREHVLSELAAHFAGHLIPVDLVHDARDGWKAVFKNHEGDKNPSTIIKGSYRKAFVCGHHPNEDAVPLLPLDLASCVEMWISELDGAPSYEPTGEPLIDRFAEQVAERSLAGAAMFDFLAAAIPANERMIVKAPEGVGKSTSLFKLHSTIVRPGDVSMYAFASYAEAQAKCASFNTLQPADGIFVGIVLPSFSEAYRRACEALGHAPLTTSQIAAHGAHRSRLEAIERLQPDVMPIVERSYRDMWSKIPNGRTAVLFTVHQVAHGWGDGSLSRSLASPRYFDLAKTDRGEAGGDLALALLVHDEVSVDTFIDHHPAHVVEWVDALRERDRAIWKGKSASIRERFASFSAAPQSDLTFDDCVRLMAYPACVWQRARALDRGEYHDLGTRGMYANAADGGGWRVASRLWWQNAADRVVWLTTENVPCIVAAKADPSIVVYDLRTPLLAPASGGTVDVHPAMDVVAGRFGEIVEERVGVGWIAISNKLKDAGVASHKLAKGSNGYVGSNVIQTMGLMGAEQYRALLALGNWCDRDLVIATHVDELFQSVGRNIGFRWDGAARHELYVNRRLWDFIRESGALTGGRYSFEINADLQMRHDAK